MVPLRTVNSARPLSTTLKFVVCLYSSNSVGKASVPYTTRLLSASWELLENTSFFFSFFFTICILSFSLLLAFRNSLLSFFLFFFPHYRRSTHPRHLTYRRNINHMCILIFNKHRTFLFMHTYRWPIESEKRLCPLLKIE